MVEGRREEGELKNRRGKRGDDFSEMSCELEKCEIRYSVVSFFVLRARCIRCTVPSVNALVDRV